jgi:hypothetical protein
MGNLTTTGATIQLYGQSLPPPERSKHRAWIGLRVEALLEHYWQSRPSEAVKAEVFADWMAALEAFTREEIMGACREWARDGQRKPRPADIREIVLRERGKLAARLPKPPEPERERVTPEAAAAIMRAAGVTVKRP